MTVQHRVAGAQRVALRQKDAPTWILVERERLLSGEAPLGVRIELDRKDHGRHDSGGSQRALTGSAIDIRAPAALRPGAAWMLAAAISASGVWAMAAGWGQPTLAVSDAVTTFGTLLGAVAFLYLTFIGLRWVEAMLLASTLDADCAWVRFRWGVVQIEPVTWRLGVPVSVPLALLALATSASLVATSWLAIAPSPAVGVGVGSLLYLLQSLYPLHPGAGAAVLERAFGVTDLPARLRWTLLSRFVPVPSRLDVDGSAAMGWLGAAFAAWAAATVAILTALAAPPAGGATPAAKIWEVGFTLLLVGYGVWLIGLTLRLFISALQLRAGAALKPMQASDASASSWEKNNPVLRHVPALRGAPWRWGTAPRGAVLIRHGSRDQRFLWLVSGRANVLERTAGGDPVLVAELAAGSGVGEVALLGDGERTADVIASEDCVVAVLERAAFESVANDDSKRRLNDLAHASQSLSRARELWGLYPDDRARWVTAGAPRSLATGETLIHQGEDARWIGMVVRGNLDVQTDGTSIGSLGPDEVFGEMAYLDGTPRSATLTATAETLVWTWSADFLDEAVGTGEIRDALRRLAGERTL